MKEILDYWPVVILGVVFSAISHAIYIVLHRKEQKGVALTMKQTEWMQAMKLSRWFFLILVIVAPVFVMVSEYIIGVAFIMFVGYIFFVSLIKKGRI